MVIADRAIGNRHRPIVCDAAAITERERIGYTSVVVSDDTVADHQRPTAVVDAATGTTTGGEAVECRGVAIDRAVRQRQCRRTAVSGIIEDASPGRSKIAGDNAVKDSSASSCLPNHHCKLRHRYSPELFCTAQL